MYRTIRAIAEEFSKLGISHSVWNTGNAIDLKYTGKNIANVSIYFFSSEEDTDVSVRIFELAHIPREKTDEALRCLNSLQNRLRFIQFMLDEDNDVALRFDIPTCTANLGEVAVEMLQRFVGVADEVYPEIVACTRA